MLYSVIKKLSYELIKIRENLVFDDFLQWLFIVVYIYTKWLDEYAVVNYI